MYTTAVAALFLSWSGSALAQAKPAGKAQIRLAPAKADAKAPAQPAPAQPAPATAPAPAPEAAGASAAEGATAPAESSDEKVLPESPESQAGTQPAPGFGPAPAAEPHEGAEDAAALSEPRIIDTSKDDGDEDSEPEPEPELEINGDELPFTYHMRHIDFALGVRVVGAMSDGLEPYLYDPVLVDTYGRIGGAFQLSDKFALGIQGEFGGATGSAYVRDSESVFTKTHITAGFEGRYHFMHRMYAYGRVAPGLEIADAKITIDYDDELTDRKVGFQVDGAAGVAFRFAGTSDGRKRSVRFWGFAEGGYRLSTKHKFELAADEDTGPARTAPLEMSALSTSGGFGSLGLMLTF
jgi:hypothetical protein